MNHSKIGDDNLGYCSPAGCCQIFFAAITLSWLGLQGFPRLRSGLFDYGFRKCSLQTGQKTASKGSVAAGKGYLYVPHGWFLHFYVVSVFCSIFWAWQYRTRGTFMRLLAERQQGLATEPELGPIFLGWGLLTLQGSRRLYESLRIIKPGSSEMLVLHWILGVAYYVFVGIAIWIEGSSAILRSWESPQQIQLGTWRTCLAVVLFFASWLKQYQCHKYLASLEKYSLPVQGMFRYLVCPHYTCECLIYIALALITAPTNKLFNKTMLSVSLMVLVSLGMTAKGTKQWYLQKFGAERVEAKWRMIPLIY